jgi:hypothetical protein
MQGPPTANPIPRRWRRRPKLPTRAHNSVIPSSLPPSSPIPSSSSSPFGQEEEVIGQKENEDPFGLLAAEVRIKAKRALLPKQTPLEEEGNDAVDEKKPAEGNLASSKDQDASPSTRPSSPSSPIKPSSNRDENDHVPEPEHLPIKNASSQQAAVDDTAECQVLDARGRKENSNAPKSKSNGKKKMAARKEEAKPVKSKTNRSGKPKSVTAPLKGKARKREPDESGDSKEDVFDGVCLPFSLVPVHVLCPVRQQSAKQREARIEYFRKLDNYVLEKENVWVV